VNVRRWEPWEAMRAKAPPGPDLATREVREDARLLLWVVRARLREGGPVYEHLPALERVAGDERVQVRRRRVAAELAARIRLAALQRALAPSVPGASQSPHDAP